MPRIRHYRIPPAPPAACRDTGACACAGMEPGLRDVPARGACPMLPDGNMPRTPEWRGAYPSHVPPHHGTHPSPCHSITPKGASGTLWTSGYGGQRPHHRQWQPSVPCVSCPRPGRGTLGTQPWPQIPLAAPSTFQHHPGSSSTALHASASPCELQASPCELQASSCELQTSLYELQASSHKLQYCLASSKHHLVSSSTAF